MRHPLWNEFDRVEKKVFRLTNPLVKRDLTKMLKNVDLNITQADKEAVECRRLNRVTRKLTEATQRAEEYLQKINKYLSMYLLME